MHYFVRLSSVFLISALALSACSRGANQTAAQSPVASPSASIAAAPAPSATASPQAESSPTTASADGQTYKEKSGLFEISLPKDYKYQETGSGIAFVSGDQGFGGSVDFGSAQGNTLNTEQLENALKQEYQQRLKQVTWQESSVQADGSVRVDWVGKDEEGNNLDAVSFVEQRGDTIFILNLFGIGKSYQDYNKDAEAIVSGYRVRSQT